MNGGNRKVLRKEGVKRRLQEPDETRTNPGNPVINYNAILPSADTAEPNAWNVEKEKNYADNVKTRTVQGTIICEHLELDQVNEHSIYKILKSHNVTGISSIYKISSERFLLTFSSKEEALKCQEYDLCGRSNDNKTIYLSFNARQKPATFLTMHIPEYISPMAVYHAFSNFGDVGIVYFGKHTFNEKIRNGKRHYHVPNWRRP